MVMVAPLHMLTTMVVAPLHMLTTMVVAPLHMPTTMVVAPLLTQLSTLFAPGLFLTAHTTNPELAEHCQIKNMVVLHAMCQNIVHTK